MARPAINKSDLMLKIADRLHIDPKLAEETVRVILDKMVNSLADGDRIEIRGFGSFEVRYREPRQARNPKTGETVYTDGKYTVHFKPGKELRDRMNESMQS